MMLAALDVKTIVLFLAMGNTVAALLVLFAVHNRALRYDFLFMLGLAAQGIGWTLIFLRQSIPHVLSFNVGNSLFLGGMVAEGICLLSLTTTITKNWRKFFIFLLFFQTTILWMPTVDVISKVGILSVFLGIYFGIPAVFLMFGASCPSLLQKLLGTILAVCSALTIIRGGYVYFLHDYTLVAPNFLQVATLLVQAVAMMVAITGYILTHWEFLYKDLDRLASTDSLTGVHNRRTFFEKSEQELSRSRRYNHSFAFMMIDVDRFKAVNDTHGHHGGDYALKEFAAHSKKVLRATDIFGRLGGEEFGVVMPEISKEQAIVAAERLRSEIANMHVHINQATFQITVSIGMTMLAAQDATVESVLQRADAALYRAKESGRNRVVLA